jgi:two-component system CheB/CheR fusion protein
MPKKDGTPPEEQRSGKKGEPKTQRSPAKKFKKPTKANQNDIRQARARVKASFPIVGIGASAGGLDAFEHFFTNMPSDTGMAFVLVQHLDPSHKSILSDLIRRYTAMKVVEVQDAMEVEPNTVYVIPPNRYLGILNGKLLLIKPVPLPAIRTPIDFFFRSLAKDRREKAICIVLSGTGTEGTLGLRAIKGEGGTVMVQDPESAKYDGMPRSAVSTGMADYVLPVEQMPGQLISFVRHAFGRIVPVRAKPRPKEITTLEKIFLLLRSQTGHDFSLYKPSTIMRRIERRMAINQIPNLSSYVKYLQEFPTESQVLFKELLIGVTNFFRDPEAFDVLREKAIPKLLEKRSENYPLRIWVPGCTTGEEAYSLAILFRECLEKQKKDFNVHIFATDIDNSAIETARMGLYPKSIAADVPPDCLEHYFSQEEGLYRVKKTIRDMIVFATQNVISDPPFSKIDLISCRNLLIYLGPELQKKVLSLCHYALRTDGILFLGSSESIGDLTNLFVPFDRKWKIYTRKDSGTGDRALPHFSAPSLAQETGSIAEHGFTVPTRGHSYREVVEKMILENYGPAGTVVNEQGEILYVHGRTGKYLEITSGELKADIRNLAREGLKLPLAGSIRQAVTHKKEVRLENLKVKPNGEDQLINLIVKPVQEPPTMAGLFVVLFEDVPAEKKLGSNRKKSKTPLEETDPRLAELDRELRSTKEYLQAAVEELQTANEEMKSTNEELQSSNEELQSTNEELETSKEELQSVNEELVTVNLELEQKIHQLSRNSSDMQNLLASTEIGVIFLDLGLNIQRFTPAMTKFIKLIHSDVGRPVSDIASNMDYEDLSSDVNGVLKTLVPTEREVRTREGRYYSMRIIPYRTIENFIDGVVVTFMDITSLRLAEKKIQEALRLSEAIVNGVKDPMIVLGADLKVMSANRSFYHLFKVEPEAVQGTAFPDLVREFGAPELTNLLERVLPEKKEVEAFPITLNARSLRSHRMLLNARLIQGEDDTMPMILLTISDATDPKMS